MEFFNFIISIFFALLFLNHAHAACVPRDAAASRPNPDAPPNIRPVKPAPAEDPLGSPPAAPINVPKPNNAAPVANVAPTGLPQASGTENPGIKKICDGTDYPDVCLSTLGRFNGPTDIPTVLGVAIQAGTDFAKTAQNTADKLTTTRGTPQDQVSLLGDCKDSFDDAAYNFQNAHDSLPAKDVGTMNTMLSAAITDAGDCQDSFEGLDNPLTNFAVQIRKMASNCLAIISQMNKPVSQMNT